MFPSLVNHQSDLQPCTMRFHSLILLATILVSVTLAGPHPRRGFQSLRPRQDTSNCARDCTTATNALSQCASDSTTDLTFFQCFCRPYGGSVAQCYSDGCYDSNASAQSVAVLAIESCLIYVNGDADTAAICLDSNDPASSACQASIPISSTASSAEIPATSVAPVTTSLTPTTRIETSFARTSSQGLTSATPTTTTTSSGQHIHSNGATKLDQFSLSNIVYLAVAAALAIIPL